MRTFFLAVKSGFVNCFNFKGRATRAEYWYFTLFYLLSLFLFVGLASMFDYDIIDIIKHYSNVVTVGVVLLTVPNFSLLVRRLHDINKTGWWLIVYIILGSIPIINLIVFGIYICLLSTKGTPGENKYGPPSTALERK